MAFLLVAVIVASLGVVFGFGKVGSTASATSNPLPVDLPAQEVLKGSPKKVFANYLSPFPISIDNVESDEDYYSAQYLNPDGERGAHAAYGGVLRERPLPRAVDSSPDWQLNDMRTEVSRASNAGLDGFVYDLLTLDGTNWERLQRMLQAATTADPEFKIMLMPDGTAPASTNAGQLAARIASIASSPALYRLSDGRLVISPFAPEVQGATWWQTFVDTLRNQYGIPVAFVPCFLNYTANADAFAPFSHGFSSWGDRSLATNTPTYLASLRNDAHSRGKIWMQPVATQDVRPRSGIYWEADNTENMRAMWAAADDGAEWVQIPTWNDYAEGTETSPSTHIGWGPLDLTSYYLARFKQGSEPVISRDVLYVSHRVQSFGLTPSDQKTVISLSPNSSPARDTVEVLSFLTAEATVSVSIGQQSYSFLAPAGVSAKLLPLAPGNIAAHASRSGRAVAGVASKFAVKTHITTQDLGYYFASSGRDASG